jgi:hypothetical protein
MWLIRLLIMLLDRVLWLWSCHLWWYCHIHLYWSLCIIHYYTILYKVILLLLNHLILVHLWVVVRHPCSLCWCILTLLFTNFPLFTSVMANLRGRFIFWTPTRNFTYKCTWINSNQCINLLWIISITTLISSITLSIINSLMLNYFSRRPSKLLLSEF